MIRRICGCENCVKTHLVVDEINSSRVDDSSMIRCFVESLLLLLIMSLLLSIDVDRVETLLSEVPFRLRGVIADPKDSSIFAI